MSPVRLVGSTSGAVTLDCPAVGGNNLITLPSGNGSANQFLKNGSTAGSLGWSSMVETATGVGIGTTQPATPLTLDGGDIKLTTAGSTTRRLFSLGGTGNYSLGTSGGAAIAFIRDGSNNDSIAFETHVQGNSHAERMRIASGPYVLFGTTVSGTNSARGVEISTDLNNETFVRVRHDAGATSGGWFAGFQYNGNSIGSITQNGTTGVAYNTSSDHRLKENIVEVTDGIARLQQLKPSRFNFISEPDKTVDGFIAHEVQAVVPEAVTGTKDETDADGNPIYQGIDQSKLVPLLTAALQEAVAKIESLEARIAALEVTP